MRRSLPATACTTTSARSPPGWTWSTRSRSATRFDRSTSAPLEENLSSVDGPARLCRDRLRLLRPVRRLTADRERKPWTVRRAERIPRRRRLQHMPAAERRHLSGRPQGRRPEGGYRRCGQARAERGGPVHGLADQRAVIRLEPPVGSQRIHVSDRSVAGHRWLGRRPARHEGWGQTVPDHPLGAWLWLAGPDRPANRSGHHPAQRNADLRDRIGQRGAWPEPVADSVAKHITEHIA